MTYTKEETQPLVGGEPTSKQKLSAILEGTSPAGKWFDLFIMGLIVINVGLFFASTDKVTVKEHGVLMAQIEFVSVVIFTVEYILRAYCAPCMPQWAGYDATTARTLQCFSTFGLIDFLAIAPYWMSIIFGAGADTLLFIRVLRILRVFRAEGKYFEAFTLFDDVVRDNWSILVVTAFSGLVVWIFMATMFYLAERNNPKVEGAYDSLLSSMWWTLVMLCGEYPINSEYTFWGKILGTINVPLAVGVFSIPTGILGAGLGDIYEQRREAEQEDKEEEEEKKTEPETCNECIAKRIQNGPLKGRLWHMMSGKGKLGQRVDMFIMGLIVLNVVCVSIETIKGWEHWTPFAYLEAISTLIFTVEYALRFYSCTADPEYPTRFDFVISFYGIVDMAAILPFYIDILTPGDILPTTFIRVLRLFRLLRADYFIGSFTLFDDVLVMQKDLLISAGLMGFVMWVIMSAIMYYTDRNNSDEEIRDEFSSGISASWITLLNLSGEYPLADYTILGRCVSSLSALAAISVFAIPTGIFADGFSSIISEKQEEAEARAQDPPLCQECGRSVDEVNGVQAVLGIDQAGANILAEELEDERVDTSTWQGKTFYALNGHGRLGDYIEKIILVIIFVNITSFILSTCKSLMTPKIQGRFDLLEMVTMIFFTVEYILRVVVAPADPCYAGSSNARWRHVFSVMGLLDFCAIGPYWIDVLLPNIEIMPTTIFRIFRLLKLLKGERYAPALTMLDDVFAAKRTILVCTGYVAVIGCIFFGNLLYITERNNHTKVDELTMGQRYKDVPHSIFYATIHMTGDYPLYQYSFWGRIVNGIMIVCAAGLMGIPLGVISEGFQEICEVTRKLQREQKAKAKGIEVGEEDELKIAMTEDDQRCAKCRIVAAKQRGFKAQVHCFLCSETALGWLFINTLICLIFVNIITLFLITDKSIANALGGTHGTFFTLIESVSAILFTIEYLLRIYSVPENPDYKGRIDYAFSFLAIVDLLAIAPWYIGLITGKMAGWSMVFRAFRVVRLLKVEHYMEAFTIFDNVIARSHAVLVATGLAAGIVWVVCATLFYYTEAGSPYVDKEHFASIPSSMYYTMIFLGGEWCVCDFSFFGKLIVLFLLLVGIGIFAVPTAILFSGFEEIVGARKELIASQREKHAKCIDCQAVIKVFRYHRTQDDDGDDL